ncbi:hypothetical protein [Lysobacter sp. CA199]|uniref:hypothetical protein n=1 Tax=Lysobacter sp. CA199 TaxID=3455608 RepID=UPI003F8CFDCC
MNTCDGRGSNGQASTRVQRRFGKPVMTTGFRLTSYLLGATVLAACSLLPHKHDRLASQTGSQVTLRGTWSGPGKLADFIVVDDETVYLFVAGSDDSRIPYGTAIVARGTLEHYTARKSEHTGDPAWAALPSHYFIKPAQIEVDR